jgi:hypothetical protein
MYRAKRVAVNPRLPDQIIASNFQGGALSPRDDEIQSGPAHACAVERQPIVVWCFHQPRASKRGPSYDLQGIHKLIG